MYRLIAPEDPQELPLRMLFHHVGEGIYLSACEANSFRDLVGALLNDAGYESADAAARLGQRLRLAEDARLLAQLQDKLIRVSDREDANAINVSSDEPFLRSLHRLAFVSLDPSLVDRTGKGRL